jgi:multidrug efflux pump subunit AcrA (membrane-fusion protein)
VGGDAGRVCEHADPTQVTGYIISQDYKEGSVVAKGQVLFEIDPRPFQALVDQARAHVAQAKAQLGKTFS